MEKDLPLREHGMHENQPQYINGTNTWANAGAELELKFHGTKAYFFGTVDPNHGKAEITIDGGDPSHSRYESIKTCSWTDDGLKLQTYKMEIIQLN